MSLEEAGEFHGHLGPFLTLGYLAGALAVRVLEPANEHELKAEVRIPLRRPYSCIIDGVQCSSRCTLGKGNIEVEDSEEYALIFRKGDKGLRLDIRREIIEGILEKDMEEGVRWLLGLGEEKVFRMTWL